MKPGDKILASALCEDGFSPSLDQSIFKVEKKMYLYAVSVRVLPQFI